MKCPYCVRDIPDGSTACNYCLQSFTAQEGVGGRRKTEVENIPPAPQARGFVPPESQGGGARRRTELENGGQPPPPAAAGRGRTVGDDDYVPPMDAPPVSASEGRQGRTKIDDAAEFAPGKVGFRPAEEGAPSVKRDRPRRVAGWMISFDFNDAGQEYVLREGRNTVGRNKDCDVSLFFDEHVSGSHAVIVYHADGECAIQDQMSSGGTFVNGQKIGIGAVSPLRSGDVLKVGRSVFKVFLLEKEDLMILLPKMRERASQP